MFCGCNSEPAEPHEVQQSNTQIDNEESKQGGPAPKYTKEQLTDICCKALNKPDGVQIKSR